MMTSTVMNSADFSLVAGSFNFLTQTGWADNAELVHDGRSTVRDGAISASPRRAPSEDMDDDGHDEDWDDEDYSDEDDFDDDEEFEYEEDDEDDFWDDDDIDLDDDDEEEDF